MKFSEMNEKQKKAMINIRNASNDLIGGLENTLSDNAPDSEEYISAKATLSNHDLLVNTIYNNAISFVYGEGSVCFNKAAEKEIKNIRFCGKRVAYGEG